VTTKARVVFVLRRLQRDLGDTKATGAQLRRLGSQLERIDRLLVWIDPIDGRAFGGEAPDRGI